MKYALISAAVLAVGSASTAGAVVVQVSEAGLASTDSIDWAQLGVQGTSVASGTGVTSGLGLNATVGRGDGLNFQRIDQSSGWSGNFAPGDALIWSLVDATLVVTFATDIAGVGAQVQSDFFGAFTGTIEVFDASDVSLGLFSINGVSNSNADDSAVFFGALSDSSNIRKVIFDLTSDCCGVRDFAMNALQITGAGTPVPEPAALALFGLGLAGLGFARKRRT